MKLLSQKIQIPIYREYHAFLQSMNSSPQFKDYKYYLKQYSVFETMVSLLPSIAYVLNFETQRYLFVSESSLQIVGYPNNEYMQYGRDFFLDQIHPEDLQIITGFTFKTFIEVTTQLSKEELKKCRFSLNFRIRRKDGAYIKVLQQYVILEVNENGYPVLSLGLITDITAHKADDKVVFSISKINAKKEFEVITSESYPNPLLNISIREKEIIIYILQGLSSKKIAKKLNVSIYTINAHRRNIYEKTKCKNVAELINFAMANGIN
jgi:DNA-binding CsgD family transcriptional regulator/PAS domain-containing protein